MFYSKPPDKIADKQKRHNSKRIESQMPIVRFPKQKPQRIILDQRIGNDISAKPQNSLPVNIYGIFPPVIMDAIVHIVIMLHAT